MLHSAKVGRTGMWAGSAFQGIMVCEKNVHVYLLYRVLRDYENWNPKDILGKK